MPRIIPIKIERDLTHSLAAVLRQKHAPYTEDEIRATQFWQLSCEAEWLRTGNETIIPRCEAWRFTRAVNKILEHRAR